jgi:hypothetical protein
MESWVGHRQVGKRETSCPARNRSPVPRYCPWLQTVGTEKYESVWTEYMWPQCGPDAGSCNYGNATPTAIKICDFLTRWGTVLQSHQAQHAQPVSHPLFFILWRFDPIPGHGFLLRGFTITLTWHTTLGRIPPVVWSARRKETTWQHTTFQKRQTSMPRRDSNPQFQQASGSGATP